MKKLLTEWRKFTNNIIKEADTMPAPAERRKMRITQQVKPKPPLEQTTLGSGWEDVKSAVEAALRGESNPLVAAWEPVPPIPGDRYYKTPEKVDLQANPDAQGKSGLSWKEGGGGEAWDRWITEQPPWVEYRENLKYGVDNKNTPVDGARELFERYEKEMMAQISRELPRGFEHLPPEYKRSYVLDAIDDFWIEKHYARFGLGDVIEVHGMELGPEWREKLDDLFQNLRSERGPIPPEFLVDPKDPSKGTKPFEQWHAEFLEQRGMTAEPGTKASVPPIDWGAVEKAATSTEPIRNVRSPKGARPGDVGGQMHYNIEGPVLDPATGKAVPPPGYVDPWKAPSTKGMTGISQYKPKLPGKGAVGGAAGGVALAALFEIPGIAYEYNLPGTKEEKWGRVWEKAKDRFPAVATMGFSDFYTGVKDILTAEDPTQVSSEHSKAFGQAFGILPTDLPQHTDVTQTGIPFLGAGVGLRMPGEGDPMPPGYVPISRKPKTRKELGELEKAGVQSGYESQSTPLPKGHGADILKKRPMYKVDPETGSVVRVED